MSTSYRPIGSQPHHHIGRWGECNKYGTYDDEKPISEEKIMEYERLLERIRQNDPTLKSVFFKNSGLNDIKHLAAALEHNTVVKFLYLSNNKIINVKPLADILGIHGNKTIKAIVLSHNAISNTKLSNVDSLFRALTLNNTLKYIDLSHNQIDDLDVLADVLKFNKTLTSIDLHNNRIDDIDSLADALKVNNSLERLNLSGNRISNVDKLIDSLKINTSLTILEISNNRIFKIRELANVLNFNNTLTTLDIRANLYILNDKEFDIYHRKLHYNLYKEDV